VQSRGESLGDSYTLRLSSQPTANVNIAIVTDGQTNVVPGGSVTMQAIGGATPMRLFDGDFTISLDFRDYGFGSTAFGEPLVFPGGISYGQITVDAHGNVVTDAGKTTIEVVNVLLRQGNDHLGISSTPVPALANTGTPTAAVRGTLALVHGGGNSPLAVTGRFNVTGAAGANQVLRTDGFAWSDFEFAVGQLVTITGVSAPCLARGADATPLAGVTRVTSTSRG